MSEQRHFHTGLEGHEPDRAQWRGNGDTRVQGQRKAMPLGRDRETGRGLDQRTGAPQWIAAD